MAWKFLPLLMLLEKRWRSLVFPLRQVMENTLENVEDSHLRNSPGQGLSHGHPARRFETALVFCWSCVSWPTLPTTGGIGTGRMITTQTKASGRNTTKILPTGSAGSKHFCWTELKKERS